MYYVTIIDGSRVSLAYGPFETHEEALACVPWVESYVMKAYYPRAHFWAYGTSKLKKGPYPEGKLNGVI